MRSELASALGLLAGSLATAAARPDIHAWSQQIRRQNARECAEDLEDILDNAPTASQWPATACAFTSTLSGAELTSSYAAYRSRMSSWYNDDLDDITKVANSCTQYASVFEQIRYCYVTGPYPTTTASTSSTAAATTTGSSTASRTSTGATSTSTSSATATPDPDGGMDDGAKAGLAIGIILAVILILFICWKFFQKYRANKLAEGASQLKHGDVEPQMQSAAAIGAAGAGAGLAGAAAAKHLHPDSSVYAYKSELSGDSRPISELDPAAAVAAPGPVRPPPHIAELDPEPPTQLSELPADNYDPTENNSPPPAYVSPMTGTSNGNTLDTAVSPLSPNSNTVQGLGISMGEDPSQGPNTNSITGPSTGENQNGIVQQGWGRGWLQRD
ncbi:uncharacterized protein CTRU02_201389 [Colletotrichum truncatum]|uniref:Uncharacterized protein n=1 Tax=Colletotrichum truncatum TaxID=5467 RepID=A0ACC3ZH69_COLTU|nr:uncharacterized protein CTRU02_08179 [Colletotrichum truncatum]KAF6790659.1 hypothetical protein CTRU02_08179 [Colletotrichum truncatum]